jgi:hypothetical protein
MRIKFAQFDGLLSAFCARWPGPIPPVLCAAVLAAACGASAQTTLTVTRTAYSAISANSLVYVTSTNNEVAPGTSSQCGDGVAMGSASAGNPVQVLVYGTAIVSADATVGNYPATGDFLTKACPVRRDKSA